MKKKELLEAYNKLLEEKLEREREANEEFLDFAYDKDKREMYMITFKKGFPKDWKMRVFSYGGMDKYGNLIFNNKGEMITPIYDDIKN